MKIKDLCFMVVFLSLLIISSKLSIEIGIISITLQTFAVAITAYLLKWKKAVIVFLAYIVMGLVGIPVFSVGGGFYYVLKPSFGFILGFLASAFIIGNSLFKDNKILFFLKGIIGLLVIDIIGIIYMYVILRFYLQSENANIVYVLQVGFLPFILKDLISVIFAGVISLRLEPVLNEYGVYNKQVMNINH